MERMDLTYPADAEEFRTEIRSWLEENLPDGWFDDGFEMTDERPELSRLEDIVPDDVHERNGNRSVKTTIDVETISLNDLLDSHGAPQTIDYLSVDTEGSEFEILEAFDFRKRRIRFVTVEHAGETAKREHIRALMEKNGYVHWHPELSRWDDWYVAV